MRQRIQTLDGLRFLAALGVLWIHTWTRFGNPRWFIGPIDITNILALGGNGVDLFFVISGFCMYYFYASKSNFSYHDFYRFLVKRWVRLSPAFYSATLIYLLVARYIYHNPVNFTGNLLHSIFYLNDIFSKYSTASHFWTLTVEWQFYFTIPFLLIYQNKVGFVKTFSLIWGLMLLTAVIFVWVDKDQSDFLTGTLLFHGVEFGCGIIAAKQLLRNKAYFRHRGAWLVLFIMVTYAGRILISKQAFALSPNYYNVSRLAGFGLMGCGFAGILYLSVTSVKWLQLLLGNSLFKSMGRISYSFYLFHALIVPVIAGYLIEFIPMLKGITAPIICTIAGTIILYPVSLLSYHFLEKPFLSVGNLTTK